MRLKLESEISEKEFFDGLDDVILTPASRKNFNDFNAEVINDLETFIVLKGPEILKRGASGNHPLDNRYFQALAFTSFYLHNIDLKDNLMPALNIAYMMHCDNNGKNPIRLGSFLDAHNVLKSKEKLNPNTARILMRYASAKLAQRCLFPIQDQDTTEYTVTANNAFKKLGRELNNYSFAMIGENFFNYADSIFETTGMGEKLTAQEIFTNIVNARLINYVENHYDAAWVKNILKHSN